jgi:hypothetical protein
LPNYVHSSKSYERSNCLESVMSANFKSAFLALLDEMSVGSQGEKKMTFEEVIEEVESADMNKKMLELFRDGGLDHRDITSWYTLLGAFSDFLDGKKKAGVRPKWVRPRPATLRRDFQRCLAENPRRSGIRICEKMKERHNRYSQIPASTLLRWVGEEKISIKQLKSQLAKRKT